MQRSVHLHSAKRGGAFHQAVALHAQGLLQNAAQLYESVLALEPDHFDCLCRLGLVRLQQQQFAQAERLFYRAIKINKQSAEVHHNRGFALTGLGRPEEAIRCYEKALALRPRFPEAHNNLGHALEMLGRIEAALAHFRKAVAVNPDYPEAQNNLGNALRALGRTAESVCHYQRAVTLRPNYAEAHENLGHAFRALGRREEALEAFKQALALRPDDPDTQYNFGNALQLMDRSAEAIPHFEKVIARRPDAPAAYANLGHSLREIGRIEEAAQVFAKAAALAPGNGMFHYNLVQSKKMKKDDPQLAAMLELERDASLSVENRTALQFALGKAFADIEEGQRSFSHILEGNALRRRQIEYDEADHLQWFARVHRVFGAEFMAEKCGEGDPSSLPVFIVGMPRSGTTLIEQILASHPKVFGAGELRDIARLAGAARSAKGQRFPESIIGLDAAAFRQLGEEYLQVIRARASAAERVTDKMPGNFVFAGLIHLMLPNARIIHAARDLRDSAMSCFSILFPPGHLEYTYDLAELGRYCSAYRRLMQHWRRVLPSHVMLEVQYEDLVTDLEPQARRIVEHCGLEWDDACLAFHRTERSVRTASVTQVRRPIYRTSVGRWRPHEKLIEPLLRELEWDGSV